jgi:Zn-dependent M28 family amino/carboxypeptidase
MRTVAVLALGLALSSQAHAQDSGPKWVSDYTARCYHQACDVWRPDWDLRGAAQDVALLYELGKELANPGVWPNWKDGSEFKPLRDASAAARK